MKRVLFVGPYRQKDEWGRSARDYIRALLTNNDISLASRPIYYSSLIEHNIPSSISSCEKYYSDTYDYIIQYGFPASFNINNIAHNIGILNIEFSKGQSHINTILLNRLNEIYVSTEQEKSILTNMGIKSKISVIPKPIDLEEIANNLKKKPLNSIFPQYFNSTFKFYCFSGAEDRRNLDMLLTAFHLAFGEQDRVSLIIAPNLPNNDIQSNKIAIENLCKKIKNNLRTNRIFKNEMIIPGHYDLSQEIAIHNACDCYINISSGCHYDSSAIIASYLGKTPIVLGNTGLESLLDGESSGFVVKSDNYPIVIETPPLPEEYDLFNANYSWKKPNIMSLIDVLKKAYNTYKNNKTDYKNKQLHGSKKINEFSYTKIGEKICL
jgi:hypothetical protein